MPDDGPIVHAGLPRRYQGAYKQLCEGHFCGKDRARTLARCIKEDIGEGGDAVLTVIAQAAAQIEQLQGRMLIDADVDWSQQRADIDDLIRRAMLQSRYAVCSVHRACRELLDEIENGGIVQNLGQEILQKYQLCLYRSRFGEHLYRPHHHLGVDQQTINEREQDMLPFLLLELVAFANQIESRKTVSRLRLRPRSRSNAPISLETDLLLVGKVGVEA